LTASSSTIVGNLAYLVGAIVFAVIGGVIIWLRHRKPKSVDANVASFRRGLSALAPGSGMPAAARGAVHPLPGRAREHLAPSDSELTHVRVDRSSSIPAGERAPKAAGERAPKAAGDPGGSGATSDGQHTDGQRAGAAEASARGAGGEAG
jgi:hypothetical protein